MEARERDAVLEWHSRSSQVKLAATSIRLAAFFLVVDGARALKRLIDIVGGTVGLILTSPVMLAAALAIKLEDGGPVFFKQIRVGKWGREFTIYKFRSMCVNADRMKDKLSKFNETKGLTFKMKDDPRITRVGRIIRKLSIDEFPQFYNVIVGDMSLVGPRPPVPREVREYGPHERRRLEVKPGITCIWQVSGRSDIPFDRQVLMDIEYIRTRSLYNYLSLIIKTVPAVLLGRGAY